MDLTEIIAEIEKLQSRAAELADKAEASDSTEAVNGFKAQLENDVLPEIERLKTERVEHERAEEQKALRAKVTSLDAVIEELRKPIGPFHIGSKSIVGGATPDKYETGERSFYADIKMANKGRQEAIEALGAQEGKAMSEGVAAQGGYLVQQSIERQIVETREQDNVLRQLCSKLNVNTNAISLDQITLGTTAGWVAELAQKPESTNMTLASVSASVFTAAGLATISNQLLADSNPAVDNLVTSDLAKRIVALEEAAFLSGNGTGQPLGILNTSGVSTKSFTPTIVSADGGLLDTILDAIAQVQLDFGNPSAILMHPRTWTRILKDKNATGVYTYGSPADGVNSSPDLSRARTVYNGPTRTLWGVPVVLTNRMPTNLGTGTNESRVIVGDFSEALILDRQGITVDESPHVFFTSNQTIFRAEARVGFTAARQPKSFCIVGGAGLATG